MNDQRQPENGWTVVLRRRPVRIVEGRPEGGYTGDYEIVCCDCGDDPDLDYCEVSPAIQRIRRGPTRSRRASRRRYLHARRHPDRRKFRGQLAGCLMSTAGCPS